MVAVQREPQRLERIELIRAFESADDDGGCGHDGAIVVSADHAEAHVGDAFGRLHDLRALEVHATAEVRFEIRQGDKSASQCLVFAWIEGSPRKNTQAFSCDDVVGAEKWKTDQVLKSAWR